VNLSSNVRINRSPENPVFTRETKWKTWNLGFETEFLIIPNTRNDTATASLKPTSAFGLT